MTDIVTIILTGSGWIAALWIAMWGMDWRQKARQAERKTD